jgi:hypothetical protein
MSQFHTRSIRLLTLGVVLGCGALALPLPAHAQGQTPVAGTPVSICGPVSGFTAATTTATGSITFSNANTTQSFTLPAGTTLSGSPAITTGMNLCLVGTMNSAGQLASVTLIPNTTTATNLCGTVTAYSPATLSSLGSLTIGGQSVTLGLGTTFTGATLSTGSNVCIAANVNGLGLVNGGTVTANAGGTTGSNLVSICGPVSAYAAPTSSAAGSITISNVSVNATYTFPAGTTTTGNLTITNGSNVCLVGTSNATGQLSSVTITPNTPTQISTCGTVSGFTAATTSAGGTLTIGSTSIPLAAGTTFTGTAVTTGTNLCFTLTVNSLGQAIGGTVSTPTPLAAVLHTTGAGGSPNREMPL